MVKDIDIASYADDNTPFVAKNIRNVTASLEQVSDFLFNCFNNNRLKNNFDKCHVLVSTNKPVGIKIGDCTIENSECEKLLVAKIDTNVNFNDHISKLCKKASRKSHTFYGIKQKKIINECFFHFTVQLLSTH